MELLLTLNIKQQIIDNIYPMPSSILYKFVFFFFKSFVLTKVVRVNWFVVLVNWTNDDDCNLILFDVVITRFVVNVIKYSRRFAWEFNSLLYWFNAEIFNGIDVIPCKFWLPKEDIEILAAAIPSIKTKKLLF
jgi:hypothetical protein